MIWLRTAFLLLAAFAGMSAVQLDPSTYLIRGARIFDGTGAPATTGDVLVRGDRIAAVGPGLRPPRGATVIDARGLTLLPGLHDLHTHLRAPAFAAPEDLGKAYAGHLLHGVTTGVDFSVSGEMLQPIREMTASGAVIAPRLQLAVRLGVPGGHGTEYGWGPFFTMQAESPRGAQLAAARALAYRPDVLKVFADGWRYGRSPSLTSMNEPTLRAIVTAAHAANVPVITHTVTLEGAKVAAAAGVDALGHGIGDQLVDDELIALMKARGTAYVPTMVVYEPQQNRAFLPAEWRALRRQERAREEAERALPPEPIPPLESSRWTILQENLRRLKAAGIRVGIGTDAGIGGVYHGSSAIREIRLLTQLGFTPAEALKAATSISAGILRKADGGRIAPGLRADLLLVTGRPDQRIDDLYSVRHVFVGGRPTPLPHLRRLVESDAMSPLPARRMTGPIDTGAGPVGRTDLDTLPVDSHEPGADHSRLHHVTPGQGRPRFLFAQMGAAPQPFAQLAFPLTRGAVHLADARDFTGVAFQVRGAGRYALLLDSYGIPPREWFQAPFSAGETAREIRIPFTAFRSTRAGAELDRAQLRALLVRLEGEPGGKAWLEFGQLRFY
jgi:imidazolonepropionase-like amidohydrolase